MYGVSRWKVHHVLRHMGISMTPKARKSQRVEEMAYLYMQHHMSTDDIGLAYGVRGSTVAMYLRDRGIEIRTNTLDLDENKIKNLRAQGYGVAKNCTGDGLFCHRGTKAISYEKIYLSLM